MVKLLKTLLSAALISSTSSITINQGPEVFCETSKDCAGSSVSLVCGWYTQTNAMKQGYCMNKEMCGKPYRPEKPEITMIECPDYNDTGKGTAEGIWNVTDKYPNPVRR